MMFAVLHCHKCTRRVEVGLRPIDDAMERLFKLARQDGWDEPYTLCAECRYGPAQPDRVVEQDYSYMVSVYTPEEQAERDRINREITSRQRNSPRYKGD